MRHGDSLVFVEVRYRRTTAFAHAAETITRTKQQRIVMCAQQYLNHTRSWNRPARFDVVCIEGVPGNAGIQWFQNAFQAAG
jgi:putative endonuclease